MPSFPVVKAVLLHPVRIVREKDSWRGKIIKESIPAEKVPDMQGESLLQPWMASKVGREYKKFKKFRSVHLSFFYAKMSLRCNSSLLLTGKM